MRKAVVDQPVPLSQLQRDRGQRRILQQIRIDPPGMVADSTAGELSATKSSVQPFSKPYHNDSPI